MLVVGIIFIIVGLGGYFYTINQMNSISHSIDAVGSYLGVMDTPTLNILNWASIIVAVVGAILLVLGIIRMIKD